MGNKKIIASFELTLMIVSLFAFSYGVAMTDGGFAEVAEETEKIRTERLIMLQNVTPQKSAMGVIFDYLRRPMVPVVSAFEDSNDNGIPDSEEGISQDGLSAGDQLLGRYLIETETRHTFMISSQAAGAGCCFMAENGQMCATKDPINCVDDSPFAEGAFCAQTSFCEKGCCYDEDTGIYDSNVLELACGTDWVDDPNCNMAAARRGCCVLEGVTFTETYGQCEVRTESFAQGDGIVDWRGDLNEGQCTILSSTQKEGACVIGDGECKFGTEATCYNYEGEFNEGFLCTSPLLESNCEPTEQTTCVDGKDGVYFLDSCGNVANIYDSTRVYDIASADSVNYWSLVMAPEEICGDDDVDDASANSVECGNCNRFLGSICRSALDNNFDVDIGENYCKDTSCMYKGENYENGESWCVYDGAIGDGDDVVGSRHWKYVCSQGTVQVEPCADFRNQICVQVNALDVNGTYVKFRNANCIANNWRECIDLNSEEDGMDACLDTLNCRVEKVEIADKFNFDICLPKYPGGFSLKDTRYMKTAETLCGMADQTCTVVYKPKTFGGCKLIANKACLSEGFAQGMNDFCRGLGDCGGSVNIEGEYSENYEVVKSPRLSQGWINDLKDLANPVPGQFAEVEDYSEYLMAAGILMDIEDAPEGEEAEQMIDTQMVGIGVAGLGYASFALGFSSIAATSIVGGEIVATQVMGPFAGSMIAFGVGMIAGAMIAKSIGLSPGGSILMSIGVGFLALWGAGQLLSFVPVCPPCLIIAVVLIIVSLLFGGNKCPPVEVEFECKPWKAPTGGDDCEKCNDDPLKPCSEYRCNSLGAACELVNKGTENELCHASEDNGRAPILRPQDGVISPTEIYGDFGADGFGITNTAGGCIDAYTPLTFGIVTDELAYCKFDMEVKEFGAMSYDLGGNAYLYNHTTTFSLPDPSHGQSQGMNWTGGLSLYIKCQDTFGHETPEFYIIDMCVKEGDDVTGPLIRATEPANDGIISFNATSQNVTIVTNEFSTCRWDLTDVDYSLMRNSMICNDTFGFPSSTQGYVCNDVFPVGNSSNNYYVRCMDQPWLNDSSDRNANVQSFVYTIRKPVAKISIEDMVPDTDFEINTPMTTIELKAETLNGGEYHFCSYSFSGYDSMIRMFETGNDRIHTQLLNRPAGHNKIYVECTDETGDFDRSVTEFDIIRDSSTPAIARAWQEYGTLYVITTEIAECKYSTETCRFNWGDGISAGIGKEHTIDSVKGDTYFIKCEDEFGNAPAGCSIMLRAL